jgi:hypothetical protein
MKTNKTYQDAGITALKACSLGGHAQVVDTFNPDVNPGGCKRSGLFSFSL